MFHQIKIKDNENYSLNTFNYQKIYSLKTKLDCYSLAFNKSSTILFIGSAKGRIKIYGFNNKLKQVQTIKSEIGGYILQIFFMQKSNELVTLLHWNNNIVIWNFDRDNFWRAKQSWKAHEWSIDCLIINKEEDMLISGSWDKMIKFWKKNLLGWSCFQIIDAQVRVSCLSLNSTSTKLIASGVMSNILVIELKPNQQWMITQKIEFNNGTQLGFMNDNSFIIQLIGKDFLEIYNYDQNKKQFQKHQQLKFQKMDILVDPSMAFQIIGEKNYLMVSQNIIISLLRINLDGKYAVQQQIKFNGVVRFWKLDSQYLVIWDGQYIRIYIRKLSIFE